MVKKDSKQFSKNKNGVNKNKAKFSTKKQFNKTRTEFEGVTGKNRFYHNS